MLNKTKNKSSKDINRQATLEDSDEISLERETQTNGIIRIIQHSLEKLKISLILPQIFENLLRVDQRLSGLEYEPCQKLIKECIREKNLAQENNSLQPHLNYHLIKVIDFFHENTKTLEYFPDWLNDISAPEKSLIESFELLQMISEQRLKKSAISEINQEKKIHEIYHENENLKKNIKVLEQLLKSRRISMKWKLAANESVIQKFERDLYIFKYENNIRIKQEILNSTKNIKKINASSILRQKELEGELESNQIKYDKLLKANLKQQKNARDEKNKLLLQLQALIKKYDETMGDKFKENMYLKDEYEKQKQEFNNFMIEYKREELEYERIVRAKEEEEKRQQEQRILLFMMNRAARIIQKYWRKYRRAQRKAAKKSKGRGKSKKK